MNFPTSNEATRKATADANSEKAYQEWLSKAETKLILSLIVSNDTTPEAALTLTRSAFEAGRSVGASEIAIQMIEAMLSAPKRPDGY